MSQSLLWDGYILLICWDVCYFWYFWFNRLDSTESVRVNFLTCSKHESHKICNSRCFKLRYYVQFNLYNKIWLLQESSWFYWCLSFLLKVRIYYWLGGTLLSDIDTKLSSLHFFVWMTCKVVKKTKPAVSALSHIFIPSVFFLLFGRLSHSKWAEAVYLCILLSKQ